MDAGTGYVLAVSVALIAIGSIVQTICLVVMILSLRKLFGRVEVFLSQVSRDVTPVLQVARELLSDTREKVDAISGNLLDITSKAKGQISRLDGMLTDASERVRLQFIRLDQLLTDTIGRVEQTGEEVRRTILAPVREISAILAGVRATLDFLFHRSKETVEQATQDEELFI